MVERTAQNPMGMKSIKETLATPLGTQYGDLLRQVGLDWIFNKWYEKVIILGSIIWAIISIVRWIF